MAAPWARPNHWDDPFPDDIDVPDCIPPVVLQVEVTQNGKTCYWGRWTETPKFINGIRLVESRKWEEMPEEERDTVLLGQAFKVRVAFSEKMKEYKKPIYVNFGKASPFGANKVTGDWIADNIWEGEYHYPAVYDSNDYQGKNTLSIYAQDKEGNMLDGRPGTVVAVNDTGRINYEDGDGQNGYGGYDVLHSFGIGGESSFQVSHTQPENGEQSADVLGDVKARFTKPVRLGDFSQDKVQFDPSLADSFIAAWEAGNRELSLSFASPQYDLKYSTNYKVTLSEDILDTNGRMLDGNMDGEPGGDFRFCFKTRRPVFDFPKQLNFYGKGQTKLIKTYLENREKRDQKYRLVYHGPLAGGNSNWSYQLVDFQPLPGATDTSYRDVYVDSLETDTIELVRVTNLGREGAYRMTFIAQARDLIDDRYLDTLLEKNYDNICLKGNDPGAGGPGGPGGDQGLVIPGGDDNWSISDPHYPSPWLLDDAADVGILLEGFYEASGHLLGRYGIPTVPVESENLALLSNLERTLSDLKVLIVPTGGLRDLRDQPAFWQRLEDYVSGGGYLMVLDQPYGDLYSRLPGSPQGRGWEEDLSCTGYFTKMNDGHPTVSGFKYKTTNIPTDGYFNHAPDGSVIHAIRLLRGGAASAITYPWGQGRVFAAACYIDQAFGAGILPAEAARFFRDAITCGLYPEWTFVQPEFQSFKPGQAGDISLEIIRPGEPDTAAPACDRAMVTLYDPFRRQTQEQEFWLYPPLMPGDTALVSLPYTAPEHDTLRGLWLAGYSLFSDTVKVAGDDGAMPFAVADTMFWRAGAQLPNPFYASMYHHRPDYVRGDTLRYTITCGNAGWDTATVRVKIFIPGSRYTPPVYLYQFPEFFIGPGDETELDWEYISPSGSPYLAYSVYRVRDNSWLNGAAYGATPVSQPRVTGWAKAEVDSNWRAGDYLPINTGFTSNFTGPVLLSNEIYVYGPYANQITIAEKSCTLSVVKGIPIQYLDSIQIDSTWRQGGRNLRSSFVRLLEDSLNTQIECGTFYSSFTLPGYRVQASIAPDSSIARSDTLRLGITISPPLKATGPGDLRYSIIKHQPHNNNNLVFENSIAFDSLRNGQVIEMTWSLPDTINFGVSGHLAWKLKWDIDSLSGDMPISSNYLTISGDCSQRTAGWGDSVTYRIKVSNKTKLYRDSLPLVWSYDSEDFFAKLNDLNSPIWRDSSILLDLPPGRDTTLTWTRRLDSTCTPAKAKLCAAVLMKPERRHTYAGPELESPHIDVLPDTSAYAYGDTVRLHAINSGRTGTLAEVQWLRMVDPLGNATDFPAWSGAIGPVSDTVICRHPVPPVCMSGFYTFKGALRYYFGGDTLEAPFSTRVTFEGLDASVELSTSKDIYFPGDSIVPQALVENTGASALDRDLELRINRTGLFYHDFSYLPGNDEYVYEWLANPPYPDCSPGCTLTVSGLTLLGRDRLYGYNPGSWWWPNPWGNDGDASGPARLRMFRRAKAARAMKDGRGGKSILSLRAAAHQGRAWILATSEDRSTLAGPLPGLPESLSVAGLGSVQGFCSDGTSFYASSFDSGKVFRINPATGSVEAGWAAGDPRGCAAGNGYVYVADRAGGLVRAFTAQGESVTVFGAGRLSMPEELAVLGDGTIAVADQDSLKRFAGDGSDLPAISRGRFSRLSQGGEYLYCLEPDSLAIRKFDQAGALVESKSTTASDLACAAETLYTGRIMDGGLSVGGEAYLNFGKWRGHTMLLSRHWDGLIPDVKYVTSFRPMISGPGAVRWRFDVRPPGMEYHDAVYPQDSLEGFDFERDLGGGGSKTIGCGRYLSFSAQLESPDGVSGPTIQRLDLTALTRRPSEQADSALWQDSIPVSLAPGDSMSWLEAIAPLPDSGEFFLSGRMRLSDDQFLPYIRSHGFMVSGWPLMAELKTRYQDYWPGESVTALAIVHNRTDSVAQNVNLLVKQGQAAIADTILASVPAQAACSLSVTCSDTADFLIQAAASAAGLPETFAHRAVNVERPDGWAELSCPQSAGTSPFQADLTIFNGWTRPLPLTANWAWSQASVAETLTVLPNTQRTVSQPIWITSDDTLRVSLPWQLEEELVRPIAFACRASVLAETLETSGAGVVGLNYKVLNRGLLLNSTLNLSLRDSTGAALDSMAKPYQLAAGDSARDSWQTAPGCGLFRLSWALMADSSAVVLDSASAMVEVVPSGTVSLDSLTLDPSCDSLGRAWVGLHVRNRSAEPFTGSFAVSSDMGFWRSDRTLEPLSAAAIEFAIQDPQEAGARSFHAHCLAGGDTVAVLSRLLRFRPVLGIDSLPDILETAIGDTVEFCASVANIGNAISRDTLSVNLGDLVQQTTELSLAPGQVHNERCLGFVPDDLEEQTVLGFASLAGRFHPITARISGYRIDVQASLDRPHYRAGDTVRLEVTTANRSQRNLSCLMSGVYRESEAQDAFLLLGGHHRIGFDSGQRIFAQSDSSWYVSGLVDPGQFDSLKAACQTAGRRRGEARSEGQRFTQVDLRSLEPDSVASGPWADRLESGRLVQFRLRPSLGDTVERVLLTRYSGGAPSDTIIEWFDSLLVRRVCSWGFDPGQGNQALLSYGVHTLTGRSLWLNTAYVYGGSDSLALWPERQLYGPGDTVRILASTAVGGLFRYGIDLPPWPHLDDSLAFLPGDTSFTMALPPEQTAGTRYLSYDLAAGGDTARLISGCLRFDVSGYRIRVHDCRLSSPSWRPGDSLSAWFRLHASHGLDLSMTARVHGPDGASGPAETTAVSLSQGYNWMELSGRIPESSGPGRGALELGFHKPGLDFGSLSFGFTVVRPDTIPPSAWFVQCPASTYECQLPYPVLLQSEDDRMASDTLYYHAGTGWIGLLPERKENSVSEFLIPSQPRGTVVAYYASVSDGEGNRARAPEAGYLSFHVLPTPAPGGVALGDSGNAVSVTWRPPSGLIAYHQYNPYHPIEHPAAVRYSPPYLPAGVASLTAWLERPDSTVLGVDFLSVDPDGLPGQPLRARFELCSDDTASGWTTWSLDTMGLEFDGDFYLGLDASGRPLYGDGAPGGYRTAVIQGQAWAFDPGAGELCAHLELRYPQAAVLYQVHRALADSSYLMLADSILAPWYADTSAGPEGRYRYLVKSFWTDPGLYASAIPRPLTVDRLAPRIGDSLAVVFGDSITVVGAAVRDGIGVSADSISAPSGYSSSSDSASGDLHWFSMPAVALGDTAVFCILAWDSAGNLGRSPEAGWHHAVNTGIGGSPWGGLPTCYGMSKAFPNPARGGCTVKYQLPKATQISLVVYNLAGQRVRVLEEGMKQAGYYRARWDARDHSGRRAAAGVYFYRLTADGYQRTERMVVVR